MKKNRRKFLKITGMAGIGVAGAGILSGFSNQKNRIGSGQVTFPVNSETDEKEQSIIGLYGAWAHSLNADKLPTFSFRSRNWPDLEKWRKAAKGRLLERLAIPQIGGVPKVTVKKQYNYDGLHIEELSWQLPYGRPTEAILLKPQQATGRLPAILAFHDHGGNKYFGCHKITRTSDKQHPVMKAHQEKYYSNFAWANEMAKRGYVVLVADAFTFGSRRVLLEDVPVRLRNGLTHTDEDNAESITSYNGWAAEHEHVMAKSLFCAGTTWPGVFLAEDLKSLDILCARKDVDTNRVGCGGLSGGGLRTVFMAGLDPRIKCTVDVGFMSTWTDFMLHKSFTHTWMAYVPLLPNELDFPEILGLRAPLPTLVLNNSEDQLYTLPEMKRGEKILAEVYKKAGAEDRLKCAYFPGFHKFDSQMQAEAFNWFDRWLKV